MLVFYDEAAAKNGTYVPLEGGFHLITDALSDEIVGIYVEGWIKDYVSQIPALRTMWDGATHSTPSETNGHLSGRQIKKQESLGAESLSSAFWAFLWIYLKQLIFPPTEYRQLAFDM